MSKIKLNGSIDPDKKQILKQIIESFFAGDEYDLFFGEIELDTDIQDLTVDQSMLVKIIKSVTFRVNIEKTNPLQNARALTNRDGEYGRLI